MKLPAFQFYPGDWRKDENLSRCSLAAKGALIEILCLAFQCEKKGKLMTDGKPWSMDDICMAIGGDFQCTKSAVEELLTKNVLKKDKKGCIFSARMVRDEDERNKRKMHGSMGGNPKLSTSYNKPGYVYFIRRQCDMAVKVGIASNPTNRLYKLRHKNREDALEIVGSVWVEDMGRCEKEVHSTLEDKKVQGEWFKINELEISSIISSLKGNAKGLPTPSSSSSTSSSTSVSIKEKIKESESGAKAPTPATDLESRKLAFKRTLGPYLQAYGAEMLKEFFEYWTEPNKSGTKFRQEMEKAWDLNRRLRTWAKREKIESVEDTKRRALA